MGVGRFGLSQSIAGLVLKVGRPSHLLCPQLVIKGCRIRPPTSADTSFALAQINCLDCRNVFNACVDILSNNRAVQD